ncbi:hypothetical protein [Stutzerimonas nitrititolerans]|uniref:hypothetical protein n=1 Tax=Stutzerimonas nitrititolerans TaxID=2482751 RepID=UPI0028ADE85A|nr:hypothetical protein [Stutzerimonas nitrititolerans]
MGLPASGIDVGQIGDIPAGTLPSVLGTIYGKAQYAAESVGAAIYKADQANARIDALEGTVGYAASVGGEAVFRLNELTPRVDAVEGVAADASSTAYAAMGTADFASGLAGFLQYHLKEIGAIVNYPVPDYVV